MYLYKLIAPERANSFGCSIRTPSRIYTAAIRPVMTFGSPLYTGDDPNSLKPIFKAERRALGLILRTPPLTRNNAIYSVATFPILQNVLIKLNNNYKAHTRDGPSLIEAARIINSRPKPNSRQSRILDMTTYCYLAT